MTADERRAHWEHVYATRAADTVSWFQAEPALSLSLLRGAGLSRSSCLIDVGGGDSRLVDYLIADGLTCLTVLDVSERALERARRRLGPSSAVVRWLPADMTADWSVPQQDFWHDRAVFHFLADAGDRSRYVGHLRETLKPGGTAVIATFAVNGPARCSGLPVVRYSPDSLARELGADFRLTTHTTEEHRTPGGLVQPFIYCVFEHARVPVVFRDPQPAQGDHDASGASVRPSPSPFRTLQTDPAASRSLTLRCRRLYRSDSERRTRPLPTFTSWPVATPWTAWFSRALRGRWIRGSHLLAIQPSS